MKSGKGPLFSDSSTFVGAGRIGTLHHIASINQKFNF